MIEARDRLALSRGMQGLAIRVARRINRVLGRRGAAYFDGWSGLKTRPPPGERPPVCRPRTWMLRVGWRRHVRIHPDEVPGRKSN